jgi:hypothetical protein
MSYRPISATAMQYQNDNDKNAVDYWLKFYIANDTTPIPMATNDTGAPLLDKCKLNDEGYPISNKLENSSIFIPHIDQAFRFVLYRSEAEADANDTASAAVNIPEVYPIDSLEGVVNSVATIADLPTSAVYGQKVSVNGYHVGNFALADPYKGGGEMTFTAGRRHDGGMNIDPTRTFPTDWTDSVQVAAWFADSGVDADCFVRNLFGDGSSEYSTGIVCNTPNVRMFNFKSPASRISNLGFFGDGSNTAFGTTTGIYIDRRDSGDSDNYANLDFIIDNCLFFDCGTGIYGWGRNVLIKDNLFTHLKTSIRCSSWIPSGETSHVDIRGWRIRGNRFHSNGWQYAYPGTTETPPASFGTWDSFCIQMPTDSDHFRHIEVTNNNADRGYSIFYRGMVAGLNMSGNTFHDFNGAMCYGLTTTSGAIDQQNEFPSQINCNLLNMRDSYLESWDVAKSYGIIITGGCNALNISGNNIENTLFDAIEVRDTTNLTLGDNNVKNAGQTKLNSNPAHEAVTLNNCDGATVTGLNISSTYSDPSHNS